MNCLIKSMREPLKYYENNLYGTMVLGWQPRYTDIEDIIRTAWQWHENHPDGY